MTGFGTTKNWMRTLWKTRAGPFLLSGILFCVFFSAVPARAGTAFENWPQIKGKHFIVYFEEDKDRETAKMILQRAEGYYQKIGARLGFTRYNDFWTWDDRARIILFTSKESFLKETKQPEWSTGYAVRDDFTFEHRMIVTYRQESNFFEALLPHEISHLILHDYIPVERIPLWFDEGVAQLQEAYKSGIADKMMRNFVKRNIYIPFRNLLYLDIRREKDPKNVEIFYAQSLSVIEFLLDKYGNSAFAKLCRNLRDEKSFEEALHNAYTNKIDSMEALQDKWLKFMEK